MFPIRYFLRKYFSDRYFPPLGVSPPSTVADYRRTTVRTVTAHRTVQAAGVRRTVHSASPFRTVERAV